MFEDITCGTKAEAFKESDEYTQEDIDLDKDDADEVFTHYRGWRLGDRFLLPDTKPGMTLEEHKNAPEFPHRLISIVNRPTVKKDKRGQWRGVPKIFGKRILTFYFVDEREPNFVKFFHKCDLAWCKKIEE